MSMTHQEIFDRVITHLIAQGQPAISRHGCAYRDRAGRSCAVGCLIPDEIYHLFDDPNTDFDGNSLEGVTVEGEFVYNALVGAGVVESVGGIKPLSCWRRHPTQLLLSRLQTMHDQSYNDDGDEAAFNIHIRACARDIARHFNLNTKVLDAQPHCD